MKERQYCLYTALDVNAIVAHIRRHTHFANVLTNEAVVTKSLGGIGVGESSSSDGFNAAFKLSDIFWITIL